MRVTSLLFLLLLIATSVFAENLAAMNPEELLIEMDTGNATNSVNANGNIAQGNATNATANPNAANSTAITSFMTGSNSTAESEKRKNNTQAESATATAQKASNPDTIAQAAPQDTGLTRPAVSISDMNNMRSLIEYRKLQVKLAKEEKELLELTVPIQAPTKISSARNTSKKKSRPTWPKVVSIQGVDGRLSATISSPAGIETVRVGSNVGPGQVVSITPKKVLVRANGRNIALKFKE